MLALVFVGATTADAQATRPSVGVIADASSLRRLVDSAVQQGMPGIQALVRIGSTRWMTAAGVASVETGRAMTTRDRIRLASLTKMLTYAATMELVKQGHVQLTDRVRQHVDPELLAGIPYANAITVEQLLDHTSGIHNFNGENGQDFFAALFSDANWGTHRWTPSEIVAFAKRRENTPTGRPGERRSYSSTGYIILGALIERVTGLPYPTALRNLVLDPVGMRRAIVEGERDARTDSVVDSYARPTSADSSQPSPIRGRRRVRADGLLDLSSGLRFYNAWAGAAGAVAASVEDLDAFMIAVREQRRTVLRDQTRLFATAQPKTSFSWNGGSWGIQTSILYAPSDDITVIVLGNATNVGVNTIDIAKRLLDEARHQ